MYDLIRRYNGGEELSGIEFLKLCVIHWKEVLSLADGCTSIVKLKLKALKNLGMVIPASFFNCFACLKCNGECDSCMLKPLFHIGQSCCGIGEYYRSCFDYPSKGNIRVFVEAMEYMYKRRLDEKFRP